MVVGNPPYITVKDKKLNDLYRDLYNACAGKYALSVPFAQRFFELAKTGDAENGRGYGVVGQITANSFMKREFGTRLIESHFGNEVELSEVIDTSGAYIPGHGTPTVILVGKRRTGSGRSATIRTVRSVQGEPNTPEEAEEGNVWSAIVAQIDEPGTVSQWVSVDDLGREHHFGKQPWILADGGLELVEQLTQECDSRLSQVTESIGFSAITGDNDYFTFPHPAAIWLGQRNTPMRPYIAGDQVRDWASRPDATAIFPSAATPEQRRLLERLTLWPGRIILRRSLMFSKTKEQRGLPWSNYAFHKESRLSASLVITFPVVSTHNHFSLERAGNVFNQHAPVIQLRAGANEEEHLRLLGLLNSSTAGFWLRMACHDKGNRGGERGTGRYAWESFFEFTGTKLEEFPYPLHAHLALLSPSTLTRNN